MLLLALAGCSRPQPPDPDVIARVGDREIRVAEFQSWMQRRATGNTPQEKAALLEEMMDHVALVQRAQAAGLERDPELRRAWENLLVNRLRELQYEPQLTNAAPSDAEIQAHYQTNLAKFTEPALRHGAILFLSYPAKATDDIRARLRQRITEARTRATQQSGANGPATRGFGPLSIDYSEDQATRYRGGDIGWLPAGKSDARFDPQVVSTLFALPQPGDISEVLETTRGCYLVKLLENRPEQTKPMDAVQASIRHQLQVQNQQRLEADWKKAARSATPSQVFPGALARVSLNRPSPSAVLPPSLP